MQIAHEGHPVPHDGPAARILRAVGSEAKAELCRKLIREAFPTSTIVEVEPHELFPVTRGPEPEAYLKAKGAKLHAEDVAAEKAELKDFKDTAYLRSKGDEKAAFGNIEAFTKEWNARPWVRMMKRKAGLADDFMMHPGSGMWHSEGIAAADDDLGRAPPHPEIAAAVPESVWTAKQAFAVVSIVEDRNDPKIEPGLQVHGLYGDEKTASRAAEGFRKVADPAPTLVVETGQWMPLLEPLWDDTVFGDISYGNKELDAFQRARRKHIDDYHSAKAEVDDAKAENASRMADVAEQLGLRVDEVETISKDDAGVEALLECLKIGTRTCREDAVDELRVKYLGADPDAL